VLPQFSPAPLACLGFKRHVASGLDPVLLLDHIK
jgi:hypothetical protein